MLPGYINQLFLAFRYFTMGQVVPIPSLCGIRTVVGAHRVTCPHEPTVVFTLQSDYAVTLKIYLPRLYARCVDHADDDVNLGRKKWKLKHLGPSDGLAYYVLRLQL